MSWYLTLRSDSRYSRSTAADSLVEYLATLPELVQYGPQEFRNAPGLPWVEIVMAKANETGNYVLDVMPEPTINVLELICAYGNEKWYESLAGRIALFLGWMVVNE